MKRNVWKAIFFLFEKKEEKKSKTTELTNKQKRGLINWSSFPFFRGFVFDKTTKKGAPKTMESLASSFVANVELRGNKIVEKKRRLSSKRLNWRINQNIQFEIRQQSFFEIIRKI